VVSASWNTGGLHVGQWTEECEKWFKKLVGEIHTGKFQPHCSKEWRSYIRNTRMATKVTFQMKMGAASFISAYHDELSQ
jgi:hypothetical protein